MIFLFIPLVLEGGDFRGLTRQETLLQPIPLSFQPLVREAYGLDAGQIRVQRGTYLIFTPDVYAPYLTQFVAFKKSQGFDVQVRLLSQVGYTAEAIKGVIQTELSNNPLLEYVLLVGDVDGVGAVPSFYYGAENDVSDQTYSHLVGDDLIPDVFVGRLSVDSISELVSILNKTIHYHRDPLQTDDGWLNRALVVAGNYSNTLPIPVTPKWTSYWVKEELELNGYSSVDTVFYPPIQQGAPLIQAAIDAGVGLVNYRGWGDANGWHYPEFHVGDVAGLNNGWMTPVFTSFVCNANDFANNVDPCLGESLLRAGTPSSPRGAVAIIGPSDLHTSTKFNNIINAYMYDAMLDRQITELAPAMLEGQLGLLTEFPQEDGPGEAQEKYFNVYNVLGDPSLTVYLGTPKEFSFLQPSWNQMDNFIDVTVVDGGGAPVPQALLVLMANDELLEKVFTDAQGKASFTLDSLYNQLDLYANRPDFIQGHLVLTPDTLAQTLALMGDSLGGSPDPGSTLSVYPRLMNVSQTAVSAGTLIIDQVLGGQLLSGEASYPGLEPQHTLTTTTPWDVRVTTGWNRQPVVIRFHSTTGDIAGRLTVPVHPLLLTITPAFALTGPVNDPQFTFENQGGASLDNVYLELHSLVDSLRITGQLQSDPFSIPPFGQGTITFPGTTILPGSVAPGSDLSYEWTLRQDTLTIGSHSANFSVPATSSEEPVAHCAYGYWMYDDQDTGFEQHPVFDWIELDPAFGGGGADYHPLDDDDHIDLALPFPFQYFGETSTEVTISSNGWISFLPCSIDYFWNYSIPMALGPRSQVAAFWDDLEVVGSDSIRVFTRYDVPAGRFIIEWSRALNNYDEMTPETFEIILYTQDSQPTATGDGVIDVQYHSIGNVDVSKNYATVG
ncbi:MAG: hypothetical protein D6762_02400, partial [Candidatus Neomarinimicrobiota bacterium]